MSVSHENKNSNVKNAANASAGKLDNLLEDGVITTITYIFNIINESFI